MLLEKIILTMQEKIGRARSISGVYYILQGKPSIQSIQDTHLFGLDRYFGLLKNYKKANFLDVITRLRKIGYLQKEDENVFTVTIKGSTWLKQNKLDNHFNGYLYNQIDDLFFMRLQLLIQVWTNAKHHHFTYIPIVEHFEVETWVKNFYKKSKTRVGDGLDSLYDELRRILEILPEEDVSIWIDQLTGYQSIGKTTSQLAMEYNLSEVDVNLKTTYIHHMILKHLEKKPSQFPLLCEIRKGLDIVSQLTGSALQTRSFLNKGYSPEEIAYKRFLKINTIYDHLVEIALFDVNFPLEEYVSKDFQEQIYQALKRTSSWRLKEIKALVDEEISYFQIRLVLTRVKDLANRGEEVGSIG